MAACWRTVPSCNGRNSTRAAYPREAGGKGLVDFFGRDEALTHICYACAEMLAAFTPGTAGRVGHLTRLIASFLAENYTGAAPERADFQGGLPIRQLHRVKAYLGEHLPEKISVGTLAALVDLSPYHFCRVFKQTTGMSPPRYVTRERVTRARQLIRETPRSLSEIGLEVGYPNPSHFAQVFLRVAGVSPTEFRAAPKPGAGTFTARIEQSTAKTPQQNRNGWQRLVQSTSR